NSPQTWDHARIFGCLCDTAFEGYDCSLLSCPVGDDPDTYYQADEQQCSGRGLCDHATGECECFPGYGSSDGKSGSGNMRDCGYLEPLSSPPDE
ncbi:hypothetical protein B484DRAFT_337461, partial [Ochromonadaceae sp. CCMP2298]